MVDTAVFSIFRRLPEAAGRRPPVVAEPVVPAPQEAPAEENPNAALQDQALETADPVPPAAAAAPLFESEAIEATQPPPEEDHRPAPAPRLDLLISDVPLTADQLGLAHPDVISLHARLQHMLPMALSAEPAGLYRPSDFRPAPWSGFSYDHIGATRTGVAAGTRILTARGEMEVEKLLPGDSALALRGPALLPISWIGRSGTKGPPVRIEAGALGPNMPRRPLMLGPDQPLYIEPLPVKAVSLVNGTTVRLVEDLSLDLFHIDVGKSEVLFAEGVPLSSSSRAAQQAAG